jgi:hypothetical protein
VSDDESLLPPLPVIRDRLTRNQRERTVLRALFRLAVRADRDKPEANVSKHHPEADNQGVPQ